jgi:hypothetical protein
MEPFNIDTQSFTKLEGISGVFNTLNSNFRVRFFSTYANSREPNYNELLHELKPMRERITVNEIQNINQVLQRDLDDYRIAKGLIPYLLNLVNGISNENHIAFFPGILGVIIPKNYLANSVENLAAGQNPLLHYPLMSESNEDKSRTYTYYNDDKDHPSWKIKHLKEESSGRISPLSLLEFDRSKGEIIVLDGQHRANAFRVASNEFFTNPYNRVYSPYYNGIATYPTDIETNLPVTLICFERVNPDAELLPDFISRKLFIDVNNNAKTISPSRQVLLDDRDPSSLIANSFYSIIAELYGFKTDSNHLSLIHLGFDVSNKIRDRKQSSILNISNPELINFTFDWYFFAKRTYNNLGNYAVIQERTLKWNPDILSDLLPDSSRLFGTVFDEEGDEIKTLLYPEQKDIVVNEFRELHFNAFYKIFNEFNILDCHYRATTKLKRIADSGAWSSTKTDTWNSVFIGGEGLYDSFKKLIQVQNGNGRPDLNNIASAMSEIEEDFSKIRAELCGLTTNDSDLMYNSFNSLAFQVALFMAFYSYSEKEGYELDDSTEINKSSEEFIERLNCISIEIWANVFLEVRKHLWEGDTNAKKWPAYHKLILRLIQTDGEYFDAPNNYNISPEAKIFQLKFAKQFDAFLKSNFNSSQLNSLTANGFIADYSDEISTWKATSFIEVQELFRNFLNQELLQIDIDVLTMEKIYAKIK